MLSLWRLDPDPEMVYLRGGCSREHREPPTGRKVDERLRSDHSPGGMDSAETGLRIQTEMQ